MFPGIWADRNPDKPAVVMHESGDLLTYRELEDRSRQLAQLLFARGLRPGDHLAVLVENRPEFFIAAWAAFRSGLHFTAVNRYLTTEEAGYILDDCEAAAVVVSEMLATSHPRLLARVPRCSTWLVVGGLVNGYEDFDEAIATHPADRLENETAGAFMLYSSGTTGRPKGIKRRLPSKTIDEHLTFVDVFAKELFAFDDNTTYLSPAPLYHSAPAGFCVAAQSLGGTAIVLENFDPVVALEAIERHRVTHSQWVPTMFVRMLKIPEADRNRFDLSSHSVAIHAAAPCPRTVKEQMLEWWGPILHEYYSATEATGMTYVGPQEWLAHPGTVGRPVLGALHICDESGSEVLRGTDGMIYFERDTQVFQYHNAPEQTRSAHHPEYSTWATLGDVGHVDDEGFLYLTDRAHFTIVAGGVNIYPQEIEDVLVLHPVVLDVGVIGVPNPDLGEEVKAVVQLVDPAAESPEVELELIAFARERLARFKVPRSIDFVAELPRLPTGKLYKRKLRDAYWAEQETNII